MKLEEKLKQLCHGNDIQIDSIDIKTMNVDVLLPYESSTFSIEVEGKSEDEIIKSFKEGVNSRLEDMINHLNDCKL